MSATPNKRLHEEAAASGTSGGVGAQNSKYPNDDSAAGNPLVGPKLGPSVAPSDHHHHHHHHQHAQPFDHAVQQDAQIPFKIRSPLLPTYHNRVSPPSNDSYFDHSVAASENRSELRDNARDLKAENRDARDLYQSGKEKDSKEAKHDRDKDDYHPDFKDDSTKTEREGYGPGNSHLSWKESKEHHRGGKRYPDIPGGNVDQLHASRANLQGPVEKEAGKEFSAPEERDYYDAHEAVGENKFDLKGEDKFKERDRKRKDLKHRDLLDKDKNERRNNLHLGSSSGDGKEPATEESEAERWERERKDPFRDKEKPKEREKEHVKREAWNGAEKDGLQNDKEPVDAYARTSELENSTLEPKKQRDHDGWKKNDGEARERKKGRDADVDEERPEKRSRWYDKDSDDGCADTDLGTEKERENFNYGVQQRKRMLRPRGSPQVANREPRFRSRTQDNEGAIDGSLMPSRRLMLLEATDEEEEHQCHCNSIEGENYYIYTNGYVERSQGKHEASTVVYRVGECMEELMKLWKEYEASHSDRKSESESSQNGPTLEIRIPAEHVTATNRQVRGGQLWGTDVYTYDSDLVAILMHTGYCRPTASPPPPAIQELRATVRVLPPQDCYISTLRNNVRSRAWGAAIGCSYRIESCCIVKKGGGTIALEPCLTHTSTLEPTLAPVVVERTMTTRAAASNALRQQRFVREVTIQYNLCNEPWIKYSLSIVADKGLKKPFYTSARLKKGEVLYLETHSRRYELCFSGEKVVKATSSQIHDTETERSQSHNSHSANVERGGVVDSDSVLINVFRWSRCKKPIPQKLMLSIGIPLPPEHLEVLEENLDWEDIKWSQTGVFIAGKELPLARVHFLAPN